MIASINVAKSQDYRPKNIVRKLGNSQNILKLKLALKLDSNYSNTYFYLARYYENKRNFLKNKGAIYYYCKYLEVNKRFPIKAFVDVPKYMINNLLYAYQLNPEYFKNDNKLSDFSPSELYKIVIGCISKYEEYNITYGYEYLDDETFRIYSLKAELEFNKKDFENYFNTCNVLLNKMDARYTDDYKLKLYDDMQNKYIEIQDFESASKVINEDLKIKISERKKTLEYQNKQKKLVSFLNKISNLTNENYDICKSDGIDVFCRNKNMRVANFSSALKFWNIYLLENSIFYEMFNEFFQNIDQRKFLDKYGYIPNRNGQGYGFKIDYIPYIYDFYIMKGKELGMVWPLFSPQNLLEEFIQVNSNTHWQFETIVKTDLKGRNDVYDLEFISNNRDGDKYNVIFGHQNYVSDSVYKYELTFLPQKYYWENLLEVPVYYFTENKEQIYKNKKGDILPPKIAFKQTYDIEKQRYDNEQAVLRAQQLQQEAEVRRLQQEQIYRETQLRLIDAENQRKQKEIDLVNAKNKHLENKHALETQKANAIFLNKFLNSSSSSSVNSNSSVGEKASSDQVHTCKSCSKNFKGVGYDMYKERVNSDYYECRAKEHFDFLVAYGKFCSHQCAINACKSGMSEF
jgi:hypothetical protein